MGLHLNFFLGCGRLWQYMSKLATIVKFGDTMPSIALLPGTVMENRYKNYSRQNILTEY